jgi:CheY-like chemotaxis protein
MMTPALTILIADRHEDVVNIVKEQLADYILLHATSGKEAIAFLDRLKSKIELAIIDLEVPDIGGWDLIGHLTLHKRKPTKIIATNVDLPRSRFGEDERDGR